MARPPKGAGELRNRGTLQEPDATANSSGQDVPAWTAVRTTYMKVEAVSGSEGERGNQVEGVGAFVVWMRYRSDVSTQWRIVLHDGKTLQITSVIDPDNRKRWLMCNCFEVAT